MGRSRRDSGRSERLFISLDPPSDVRRATALWGREVSAGIRGGRAVHRDSIHITLAFLGFRPPGESEEVAAAIRGLTSPPARLETAGPALLPARRPRAIAIEVADRDDSMAAIRNDLLEPLAETIGWRPDRSGFLPHMTAVRLGRAAERAGPELPPTPALEFEAREVVLYRSTLDPSGAIYEVLERFDLDPTAAD